MHQDTQYLEVKHRMYSSILKIKNIYLLIKTYSNGIFK